MLTIARGILLVAFTISGLLAMGKIDDADGGFMRMPTRLMGGARGANPAYDRNFTSADCGSSNANTNNNEVGDIQCASKGPNGNYIWYKYACVVCSAPVPAFPLYRIVGSGATQPLQASTQQQNLNCGTKQYGRCDLSGQCSGLSTDPNNQNCATSVTPNVPQPTQPPGS